MASRPRAELLALPDGGSCLSERRFAPQALSCWPDICREVSAIGRHLIKLPAMPEHMLAERQGSRWAWEIPGRKRQQIEAFAAATNESGGQPCSTGVAARGISAACWRRHGRRRCIHWRSTPACALDQVLALARRADVMQEFVISDAMTTENWPQPGQHAVALHACGELHRRLIQQGA